MVALSNPVFGYLKWREVEWIATILQPEYAHEEAVHDPNKSAPDEDSELLGTRVGNTRNLDSKGNGSKSEGAI